MIQKTIKSLTVEYSDGGVETFREDEMFHVSRADFKRGATDHKQNFTTHIIRWSEPVPLIDRTL